MKKIISLALCFIMLFSAVACSKDKKEDMPHVEGTLTEIFGKIYANAGVEVPMTMETDVTNANKMNMFGTTDVTFLEARAAEAAIMTIPHLMVLLRVDPNSDIEQTKQLIRDNADPRKWICVGVDPEEVIVDSIGDLIFFVMSANAEAYRASFLKLAETEETKA